MSGSSAAVDSMAPIALVGLRSGIEGRALSCGGLGDTIASVLLRTRGWQS